MLPPDRAVEFCPECGGKLLYNGQAMVCIACPFEQAKPDSEKRLPAARSSPEGGHQEKY